MFSGRSLIFLPVVDAPSIAAPDKLRYDVARVVADDFKPDRSVNVANLPGGNMLSLSLMARRP